MYINFKSKYKKIIWFIIGFVIACFYVQKVNALTIYDSTGDITVPDVPNDFTNQGFVIYQDRTYPTNNLDIYLLVLNSPTSSTASINTAYNDSFFGFNFRAPLKLYVLNNNSWVFRYNFNSFSNDINYADGERILATSIPITSNVSGIDSFPENFGLISSLPSYLHGYQKITLTTDDKYYMLSGLSSGSVFIPIEDFNSSGGRLSYYDNDLSSQPYTSYIQDYTITGDGLYARQDFNLNNYYGADWVMFSKYIYLEGEDDITYDIWVPEDITYSDVTITPNSSGGNNFDFQYKDSNGDIQNATATTIDLTPPQPLLSDVFNNFTTNYYGLSSIILSPISFLESVNNATCTPLTIPSPIGSDSFTLPCMTPIYQSFGGDFFTLYQTITTGFIAYYVGLGYFNLIKGLKDPSDDRIEVIHL